MDNIVYTPYIGKWEPQQLPELKLPEVINTTTKKTPVVINPLPEYETQEEEIVVPTVEEPVAISKRYSDNNAFIKDMTNAYTSVLSKRGIPIEYAKRLAVQDAMESAYGSKYAGNWNFGNIIVGNSGASYTEGNDHDAKGNKIVQKFRNFDTLDDYLNYKVSLLNGSRYNAFTGDPEEFYERVQAGGYATSPTYAKSLNKWYAKWAKLGMKLQSGGKIADDYPESYQKQFDLSWNPFKRINKS